MRIKGLTPLMLGYLERHKLNNSTVVIDAQSVFFRMYNDSKINYALGCESDKFATYIKTYLIKFKKANMNCHFVFKGGHKDEKKLDVHFEAENRLHGRHYIPGREYDDIVKPLFTREIWFQALDEMGFKYVVCNDDHVTECIALALKLSCPLIGNNMQYFFSQVQYIPESDTVLDEDNNLRCGIYTLSRFMKNNNMTEDKVILFIMICDQHIFKNNLFQGFFQSQKMLSRYNNIVLKKVISWIAQRSTEQALTQVFKYVSKLDQALFMEKKTELENLTLERKKTDTKMTLYLTGENKTHFIQSDPDWFEKGVFFNHIAIPYVNLYRYKIIKASNLIEDYKQENSRMLSVDIVKYAFDLLTNFEGGEMRVEHKKDGSGEQLTTTTIESSISKPDYEATLSVFENGWDNVRQLNLFEHFVTESLQTFDFDRLNRAPADCRLLLIALVYFSRKKPDVKLEVHSILLSYVMLGVVSEKVNIDSVGDGSKSDVPENQFIDSFTDKDLVTAADSDVAWSLMSKYFDLRLDELCNIFNRETLHPLVEFQSCLLDLNHLNQLCGSQFDHTVYSKTYNGTFVYKILHIMKDSGCQDGLQFIKNKLSPAPTVLAFLSGIIGVYESIMYEY